MDDNDQFEQAERAGYNPYDHTPRRTVTPKADAVIYKYPLGEYPGLCTQPMPESAQVVHVGQQHGVVTVWALVDPAAPKHMVTLRVVATGEPFNGYYLGTAQMPNGLVWHVVHGGDSHG